jgi:hypothetical protein
MFCKEIVGLIYKWTGVQMFKENQILEGLCATAVRKAFMKELMNSMRKETEMKNYISIFTRSE